MISKSRFHLIFPPTLWSQRGEQHHFRDEETGAERVSPQVTLLTSERREATDAPAPARTAQPGHQPVARSSGLPSFSWQATGTASSPCLIYLCYPRVWSNVWWMDGWTLNGWIIMNGWMKEGKTKGNFDSYFSFREQLSEYYIKLISQMHFKSFYTAFSFLFFSFLLPCPISCKTK